MDDGTIMVTMPCIYIWFTRNGHTVSWPKKVKATHDTLAKADGRRR